MIKPKPVNKDGQIYASSKGLELVATVIDNREVYLVFNDKFLVDIEIQNINELPVGSVFAGRITEVNKDIHAAFVLGPGKKKGFLRTDDLTVKPEEVIPVRIIRASSKGKLMSLKATEDDISHLPDYSVISLGEECFEKLFSLYDFERILTDDQSLFDKLKERCEEVCLYKDEFVSLKVLYEVSKWLKEATGKIIWLKSGANITVESTEAMTVVDVNSAKSGSSKDEILNINLEAANEVFRQLNLRNISGIVIVDFINMKEQSDNEILMNFLRETASEQKVFTKIVDMTPLGLVEITRKKIGPTVYDLKL